MEDINLDIILDTIPGNFYCKDLRGRYLWCNTRQAISLGFKTPKEIIGKTDFDLYSQEFATIYSNNDKKVVNTGKSYSFEEPNCIASGTSKVSLSYKAPLKNEQGNIIGILGNSLDITDYVNFQKKLTEEKEYAEVTLENIVKNLPGHVYWKNTGGVFLGCNDLQAKSAGFDSPKDLTGKTDHEMPWKDQADDLRKIDKEIIETREEKTTEELSLTESGKLATYLSKKVPLIDKDNNVVGVAGISFDITKEKAAEKIIESASKSKSIVLFAIDRIVRDYLTSIKLFSGLIKEQKEKLTKKEIIDYVDNIDQSCDAIIPTLDKLRYFVDLESGNISAYSCRFDLKNYVAQLLKEKQSDIMSNKIKISFFYDDNLSKQIIASKNFLGYVLNNLITNAIQNTMSGDIVIHINKLVSKIDEKTLAYFSIKDSGCGIQQRIQDTINNFINNTVDEHSQFTQIGLGLATCIKMIEKMHGEIDIKSKIGIGTNIVFTVPVEEYYGPTIKHIKSFKEIDAFDIEGPQKEIKYTPKSFNVLIAEDSDIVQLAMKQILASNFECKIFQEKTVQGTIEQLKKEDIDIVFSDVNLEDGTGIELVQRLRDLSQYQNIPVIAFTACIKQEELECLQDEGFDEVHMKPISFDTLIDIIKEYIFKEG